MIESDLRRNHPLKGHMDKAEQKEDLMDEKLGIIPKEPQWRPADPVDWPRQFQGRWVDHCENGHGASCDIPECQTSYATTLDNPQFEDGNWPGYLGHADDFRP